MEHDKDKMYISKSASDEGRDLYNYVSLKLDKLNQALYMITNYLSDSEPIKWKVRNISISTVSDFALSYKKSGLYNFSTQLNLPGKLNLIVKLLDTIAVTGAVSEMNLAILKQEYGRLIVYLEKVSSEHFTGQFTAIEPPHFTPLPTTSISQSSVQTSVRHNLPGASSSITDSRSDVRSSAQPLQKQSSSHVSQHLGSQVAHDEAKMSRKGLIQGFLQGRSWTSIKDIAAHIKGCSRKTVQRDLAELVEAGMLHKQGERRWSRYMLVK